MRKVTSLLIPIMMAIFVMAAKPALCAKEAPPILTTVQQKVAAEFDRLDAGLKQAAQMLGTTGLTGDNAGAALTKLCSDFDYAADCASVDLKGKMVAIEPAPFRKFVGTDISGQKQVKRILKTGKPVMSNVFRSVEGFPAVDIEYPVMTPEGQRLGSVSVLFYPEKFLGKIIIPAVQGTPVDIWAMEKGGIILYDIDASQIGMNLFTSQLYHPYPSLISAGRSIAGTPEGKGAYTFLSSSSTKVVKKNTFWQSVSMYGAEWRLVAIHEENGEEQKKTGIVVPAVTAEQKLDSLAAGNAIITALTAGDKTGGMKLFKEFYDDTPGIYSVQWVDEKGINRFGYPRENSLTDYDFNASQSADEENILKILAERKPVSTEKPLLEGRTGIFTFRPVFKQDQYLGMVYFIRLKD